MLASDVAEKINLQQKHFNFIFISSLIALLFCDDRIYRVDSFSNVLLFLIILSVAKGADLFGLLRIRGFRRLGVASYSIYVMHALVIMCVFKLFNSLGILKNNPITIMLPLSISVLYISLITYHLIEKRFMTLGRGVKFSAPALTDKNANQIEKP